MENHTYKLYGKGNGDSESVKRLFCKLESGQSKRFLYKDLMSYTDNLTTKVGSGGFSTVYKGQYPDGQQIVVKVLTENEVVEGVFITEVTTIATISHRNLVKLHGYCFDHRMKALVYEYMENGSLDQILFTKQHSIEWVKLYGIAIETAKALAYLHEGCDHTIIHHDVKPFNVLLDSKLSAKVTDFGLARLKDRDLSHVTVSRARGTPGYGAPEMWMPSSHVTEKCDVYSFGMMLFEIFGRRRNTQIDQKWFPKQVWEKFVDGKIYKLIEECGIMEKDREKAKILAMIALWCAQFTPERRPPMSIVANMLEERIQVKDPPNPFPWQDTSTHGSDVSLFVSPVNEQSQEELKDASPKVSPAIDERLQEEPFQEGENDAGFLISIMRSLPGSPLGPERNSYRLDLDAELNASNQEELKGSLNNMLASQISRGTTMNDPAHNASTPKELKRNSAKISASETSGSSKASISEVILTLYERRCPPGGEQSVVLYIDGDRRKSKLLRDTLDAHYVERLERDIKIDPNYKMELEKVLGREKKLPVLFVKGRYIGGKKQVYSDNKFGILMDGFQKMPDEVEKDSIFQKRETKPIQIEMLSFFRKMGPPGGKTSIILYTNTKGNRAVRRECNFVRSTLESHKVKFIERDVSDQRYEKELLYIFREPVCKVFREPLHTPALFVKGRHIANGKCNIARRLEEEGTLGILLDGMPRK